METGGYTVKNTIHRISAVCGLFLLPIVVFSHHSVAGTFDTDQVAETEGEITSLLWRNPHVRFSMTAADANGETVEWEMEMTSLTTLRRRGLNDQFLNVGDTIRVAGYPASDGSKQLYLLNLLFSDGEEIVLTNSGPRWSDRVLGTTGPGFGTEDDRSRPALGIYRIWSTPLGFGENNVLWERSYPLTPAAEARLAVFNPMTDAPTLNCAPKGMPTIMAAPYPMEILERNGNVVLIQEEYDTVRTIYLNGSEPDWVDARPLGYTVGRWEGETLVAETTGISWRHFDTRGIPLTDGASVIETFAVQDNGARLDYTMTVYDPLTFTEPVMLSKSWVWLPDMTIERFDCTN